QLDLHALLVGQLAGVCELLGGEVDADCDGALLGEGDRALRTAASELEHPLALDVAAEAEVGLGADVAPVVDDVGGQVGPGLVPAGVCVPCPGDVDVRHAPNLATLATAGPR